MSQEKNKQGSSSGKGKKSCWGPAETMKKRGLGWVLKDEENLHRQRLAEDFTSRCSIAIREEE